MTSILVGLRGDKDELSSLKCLFKKIDLDGDGFLSYEEISYAD